MNLARHILDALGSARPTQNQRMLRLHTPLEPDVLLAERAEVVEAIGPEGGAEERAGFCIRLAALSTDAHLRLDQLVGQPVLLEMLTAASRSELRPWHGHVTRFTLLGSDGGLARYELVIEPWLAFLRWRRDSVVFQDKSVPQIIESVFARYAAQGRLMPGWRWELADARVYSRRSLCIQYDESDLSFVFRLMAEEGLFCWFEHRSDAVSDVPGTHTLVIADHNGCFAPAAQPLVRFTQSGSASFTEDGLQRWQLDQAVCPDTVELASFDYRSLGLRPSGARGPAIADVPLDAIDVPGLYAYEDSAQGARLARRWLQALQAGAERWVGEGSVRGLAPASTFELLGHPQAGSEPCVALSLTHRARNNLSADAQGHLQRWLGDPPCWTLASQHLANSSEEPLYRLQLVAQRVVTPVRAGASATGLNHRPTVPGTQTAIVVGTESPVHTDRDHRVKIQFHWQRGARSSHRLSPARGCNAPASDASGTWVRVSEALAGANWGTHFVPRVGQEVVVCFVEGDIDRPVVTGAVYNGVGQAHSRDGVDGQGNILMAGHAGASGNAPAWFAGSQTQGALQAHQHNAVLTGHKSQELAASASGNGGFNQWVMDDSPGANRIELASTSAATRLQLGHLLLQRDNQRLQSRGHGFDLVTSAHGALRAGSGLLLSAHGRPSSTGAAQQMDSREPQAALDAAQQMAHTLAASAQKHDTKLANEAQPSELLAAKSCKALRDSLNASDGSEAMADDATSGESRTGGGLGRYATFARPDLVFAAPGGVSWFTPASTLASADGSVSLIASQDITATVQRNFALAARSGIVWFTDGQAQDARKPNTETGIKLHAATGSVSVQAASAKALVAADKKVEVASTTDAVMVGSPLQVLLNGSGSSIRIAQGSITLSTSGLASFRAAMKELTGAASANSNLTLAKPGPLKICEFRATSAAIGSDALVSV